MQDRVLPLQRSKTQVDAPTPQPEEHRISTKTENDAPVCFFTDRIFVFSVEDNRRIILSYNDMVAKVAEVDFIELFYFAHKITKYLNEREVEHTIEIKKDQAFSMVIALSHRRSELCNEMRLLIDDRLRVTMI